MDAVAVGQGDGLEVHHLQKSFSASKAHSEVGQEPLGLLKDPVEAREVGEGGEVGLQGGLGGQVAFGVVALATGLGPSTGEVLALEEQKDGEGQELG